MNDDIQQMIKEIVDRSRRIETKLTRLLCGETDRGVTKIDYSLTYCSFSQAESGWKLALNTRNVTLADIIKILERNDVKSQEAVMVFENDNHIFTMEDFCANRE